jgi:hypothetical protein
MYSFVLRGCRPSELPHRYIDSALSLSCSTVVPLCACVSLFGLKPNLLFFRSPFVGIINSFRSLLRSSLSSSFFANCSEHSSVCLMLAYGLLDWGILATVRGQGMVRQTVVQRKWLAGKWQVTSSSLQRHAFNLLKVQQANARGELGGAGTDGH